MIKDHENLIKGRIAETIVEEMFRDAGYQVYRFGYESFLQSLVQKDNRINKRNIVGKMVSSMPDFLVVKNNKPDFIEVKFRKDGKLDKEELESWSKARVLLVSPSQPFFQISSVTAFIETGKLYKLDEDNFLSIKKEIIDRYIPLIKKYLGN